MAIYARVSTDKQKVDMQLRKLEDFVKRSGWHIYRKYVDQGYTGANINRPAFIETKGAARKRKFNILLVWKLDRLSRSLKDLINTLDELGSLGVDFISYENNLDTSTPMGKLIFQIIGAVAEFEKYFPPIHSKYCPELVIVDEAHTCAKPTGAGISQQQRYHLLYDLSKKPDQHFMLLTATPHSGKPEQFSSLLGLLKPEYALLDLPSASQGQRRELADHYVQRRRADVLKWMDEDTPFPKRDAGEYKYELSTKYADFYDNVLEFVLGLVKDTGGSYTGRKRYRYWSALALLRGIMSSPAAGLAMIENKLDHDDKAGIEEEDVSDKGTNPLMDEDYGTETDLAPMAVVSKTTWSSGERKRLGELASSLRELHGLDHDFKALQTVMIVKNWVSVQGTLTLTLSPHGARELME